MPAVTAIVGAVSAYNTVTSFAGTLAEALRAENPGEALRILLGVAGGGGDDLILRMRDEIVDEIEAAKDFDARLDLNGQIETSNALLQDIRSFWTSGQYDADRTDLIAGTKRVLTDALADSRTLLAEHLTPGNVAVTTAAVSAALTARIAAVDTLQDGAFALTTVRTEIRDALTFLREAHDRMRDSFDVNVTPNEFVAHAAFGNATEFFLDSETVDFRDFDHIWSTAEELFGFGLYGADGDDKLQFLQYETDWKNYKTFADINWYPRGETINGDVNQFIDATTETFDIHRQKHEFAEWLETSIEDNLFYRAGIDPSGSDWVVTMHRMNPLHSGEEITGTTGGDVIDYRFTLGSGDQRRNPNDGPDYLNGRQGNDLIFGGDGDDILRGGQGADTLVGGWDDDVLYGGASDPANGDFSPDASTDIFVFQDPYSTDTIRDFDTELDLIYLGQAYFDGLGDAVTEEIFHNGPMRSAPETARLIVDGTDVWYDEDGGDHADAIHFAVIHNAETIDHENFVVYEYRDGQHVPVVGEAPEPATRPGGETAAPEEPFDLVGARPTSPLDLFDTVFDFGF